MKKYLIVSLLFLGSIANAAGSKVWITRIVNNSPFYVKIQSSDPSAKNYVKFPTSTCQLNKSSFIVDRAVGDQATAYAFDDFVLPWQSYQGQVQITVEGVNSQGDSFIKSSATLQDKGTVSLTGSNVRAAELSKDKDIQIVIDKNGTVIVEPV